MYPKLLLILTILSAVLVLTACKKDIYIAGLFPLLPLLNSSIAITELAVREINANPNILPDHNLIIKWRDTNCDTPIAFKSFTEFMQQDNVTFVSVFGLPCLAPTSAIADILSVYNTMMITFSAYTPDFYALYYSSTPTFVINGFPNSLNVISAQLKFITDHQWRRVAIVNFESEYFTHLGYELQKALYKLGIENTAETISIPITDKEYYEQIDDVIDAIQSENYRIIIFNTYHWTASDFFCRVANRSLNFREYTFILPGSYLYLDSFDIYWINGTCTISDLLKLVSGSIGFTQYPRIKDFLSFNHKTISGLTSHQIVEDYGLHNFTLVPELWNTFGPYMYDSMWALALGLHDTVLLGYEPANLTEEIRLNFTATLWSNVLNNTFESLTGQVSFMEMFRVSREVQLIEYTYDSYEFRGLYINLPYELSKLDDLSDVELINSTTFLFWNSRSDGIEDHYSHVLTFTLITLLSIFVGIYITVYIVIISYGVYKGLPPATHSEPAMSIFILVSNLFLLAFAVLLNVDGKFTPFNAHVRVCSIYCHMLVWLGFIATSLILGGVLAKAFKLYALWVLNRFQKKSRKQLRFRYLVLIPIMLVFADTFVILIWYGINPILYVSKDVLSHITDPPIYRIYQCDFRLTAFLSILIVIKVALVIICVFLAYHLRNVTHKSQRYSFIIGLIMYNTLFFAILISFVLGFVSDYDIKVALASLFGVLSSLITASIIGIPIVYYMVKDPTGKNLFEADNVDIFPEDADLLKRRINALEKDLKRANSQDEPVGTASPKKYSFLNENQTEFVLEEKISL